MRQHLSNKKKKSNLKKSLNSNHLPLWCDPICLITSHICAAISRVGVKIITCKPLLRFSFSNAIIENTTVFPVPDFASSNKSVT